MNNYNNEYNNETSRGLVLHVYNTIMDMLSYDSLYDDDNNYLNTIKRINEIERMKPFMPTSIFDAFKSFIKNNIEPIIDDGFSLEGFLTSEYGCRNDKGIFEFKDEMSAKLFVGRVMQHCIELQEKFLKLAMDEISPYFQ